MQQIPQQVQWLKLMMNHFFRTFERMQEIK